MLIRSETDKPKSLLIVFAYHINTLRTSTRMGLWAMIWWSNWKRSQVRNTWLRILWTVVWASTHGDAQNQQSLVTVERPQPSQYEERVIPILSQNKIESSERFRPTRAQPASVCPRPSHRASNSLKACPRILANPSRCQH
jgi:hypothetical protein